MRASGVRRAFFLPLLILIAGMVHFGLASQPRIVAAEPSPRSDDQRIKVDLFAADPEVVTPTGLAVDRRGRVFVAESHTHFRPPEYDGPKTDRILIFEDTNGDGKADQRKVFHEGFTYVMDIEFAPDGSLYVATRMDIHRLRDTNGDDQADDDQTIVRMETEGNYPHNGLSGLAFDLRGRLNFGLGENLGKPYTLIGHDNIRLSGGGEGGSTYRADADGQNLRRTSTGWWNPFGMCVDSFGRVFGTDNDPDASPPCRLIQVVDGGDYGYEFRYGRTGLHPLTTWNGTLPGTLPMISGTGEAPCAVVAYDSTGLPSEYRGQLLVASWADHRIERYPLEQTGDSGLVKTTRQVLVEGGDNFRPVGIDVAPDGSVYISDWVSSSYALHKLGRVWRIRSSAMSAPQPKSTDSVAALESLDRHTRERAARSLLSSDDGAKQFAAVAKSNTDPFVRATAVQALAYSRGTADELLGIALSERDISIQATAVRAGIDAGKFGPKELDVLLQRKLAPAVLAEALRGSDSATKHDDLLRAWSSADPVVRQAVSHAISAKVKPDTKLDDLLAKSQLLGLLAWKGSNKTRSTVPREQLAKWLRDNDRDVRLAATKWIADDMRKECREDLVASLSNSQIDSQLFLAAMAAIDRVDGKPPTDRPSNDLLLSSLRDRSTPVSLRRVVLRLMDPTFPKLKIEDLTHFVESTEIQIQLEAVRTLSRHPSPDVVDLLKQIATSDRSAAVRAAAVNGLSIHADEQIDWFLKVAADKNPAVAAEALRGLVGCPLSDGTKQDLARLAKSRPELEDAVQRLLRGKFEGRPSPEDLGAWMRLVSAKGNAEIGERIFFGNKVGTCSRCHTVDGRGNSVGPDLSRIHERFRLGTADRKWLFETILTPGKQMAPQYTPWVIQLKDGRSMTGLPRRKGGNYEAYLGVDGKEFTLKIDEIEDHHEAKTSLMPLDLLVQLTPNEIADLFAFVEDQAVPKAK